MKLHSPVKLLSRVQLFAIPRTLANQPSMEFSRQEYLSGLPFPFPGDLPIPGIEPRSPALQADTLLPELPGEPKPGTGNLKGSLTQSTVTSLELEERHTRHNECA